jgi:histidinol-phosphatase
MPTIDDAVRRRQVLDDLVELVRAAGDITMRWFRHQALAVERKDDGTPVTEADRAAERFLRVELEARFPDDGIIGEEEHDRPGNSGAVWVIDPIDGTKAFARGVPLYSNLLARYDADGCELGIINLPALGETVFAARGLGCHHRLADGTYERPRVSAHPTLDGGCLCTSGLGPWSPARLAGVERTGALLRTWGDGYGFALLVTGRIEAMVDPRVALWDLGPLPVLVAEAGGRFTDVDGGPSPAALDPTAVHGAVATNGLVHAEVLALLAE